VKLWGDLSQLLQPKTPNPAPQLTPPPRVLLVESELAQLRLSAQHLSSEFEVSTAASADRARQLLKYGEFDVICAEHLLPEENGLAFLTEAKAQRPEMMGILFASLEETFRSRTGAGEAVFCVLYKPFPRASLLEVVRGAVRTKQIYESMDAHGAGPSSCRVGC